MLLLGIIIRHENECLEAKMSPRHYYSVGTIIRQTRVTALQREDGTLATDDSEKAEMLIQFFSSVLTIEDTTDIPNLTPGQKSEGKSISDFIILESQVETKLKNLNPNKSPGPDGLYPRVLQELSEELAHPLAILFNKSRECGKLPQEWKLAEITPIFKKGNKASTNNYRPVSLTCILCKVMESFVRDAIQYHMEMSTWFQKGKSCMTQLLDVMNNFCNYIEEGKPFDVIYLDFKKAFDSVPHERLLVKLKAYGIDGEIFLWIRDFLSNRLQYVKVGKEYSSTMKVTSGIPQGSILGPILFLIFINDLPACVESICQIFADDTKVYNSCDNSTILQEDVDALQQWSYEWQLFFNCTKCKCIHYGKNNPCTFSIQEINKKKYLSAKKKKTWVLFLMIL